MNKITKYILFCKQTLKFPQCNPLRITRMNNFQIIYPFTKRSEIKKKHQYNPSMNKPKDEQEQIKQLKKNIGEVKKMLTPSEATLKQQTLKSIITEQRTLLSKSLNEQIQREMKPFAQKKPDETRIKRLIRKYMTQEQLNKYYILRPLKYLQNVYFSLFLGNVFGLGWFQYLNEFNSIGWFYGYFTAPAATSALAIIIGYNFSFWIVKQIFHIHVPLNEIQQTQISLIKTTWKNVIELCIIGLNFSILVYSFSFGFNISLYKLYLILSFTNFMHLGFHLYEILKSTAKVHKLYILEFGKNLSIMTLLILFFGIYSIQINSANHIEDSINTPEYRNRVIEINKGYNEFLNYFKQKKYKMKQDQKINPEYQD